MYRDDEDEARMTPEAEVAAMLDTYEGDEYEAMYEGEPQ